MRSDKIKKGILAAPQRALLHALGVTEKELEKPFIVMAAARLNVPSIFISGGAMLAGDFENKKISYSNISEL